VTARALAPVSALHDARDERVTLPRRLHAEALELASEPHVGVQPGRVLVEVEERSRASVEDPA
jgi:hypothetical protein